MSNREIALKQAVEYWGSSPRSTPLVIKAAESFEEYLNGGTPAEDTRAAEDVITLQEVKNLHAALDSATLMTEITAYPGTYQLLRNAMIITARVMDRLT